MTFFAKHKTIPRFSYIKILSHEIAVASAELAVATCETAVVAPCTQLIRVCISCSRVCISCISEQHAFHISILYQQEKRVHIHAQVADIQRSKCEPSFTNSIVLLAHLFIGIASRALCDGCRRYVRRPSDNCLTVLGQSGKCRQEGLYSVFCKA